MDTNVYEIDLHGSTMAESKMILDEVFDHLSQQEKIKKLHIVVGIGRGSDMGPVLPSFVLNYLKGRGLDGEFEGGVVRCVFRV